MTALAGIVVLFLNDRLRESGFLDKSGFSGAGLDKKAEKDSLISQVPARPADLGLWLLRSKRTLSFTTSNIES
jgi:hypothetical protein